MEAVAAYAGVLVASYLYGAIPWGVVLGKALRGIDVRRHGSGNIGFTNTLRTMGAPLGFAVLVLDASKGALPVLLAPLLRDDPYLQVAGAVSAITGHTWPVFLHFRGGKGVATATGAIIAMAPLPALALCALSLPFMLITRYVSLTVLVFAPLLTAVMLGLAILDQTEYVYFAFIAAATAIVYYRHRDNIRRLRSGTESKLGQRTRRAAS
jgi:glycerol-3-phosphate acyltransferase PlsY